MMDKQERLLRKAEASRLEAAVALGNKKCFPHHVAIKSSQEPDKEEGKSRRMAGLAFLFTDHATPSLSLIPRAHPRETF